MKTVIEAKIIIAGLGVVLVWLASASIFSYWNLAHEWAIGQSLNPILLIAITNSICTVLLAWVGYRLRRSLAQAQPSRNAGQQPQSSFARTLESTFGDSQSSVPPSDCFLNLSFEMLVIGSIDGYFTQVHPAWERTLGFTCEELKARPFIEFIHPDDREATQAEIEKLKDGMALSGFENRYRCKDGSYKWLSWTAVPFLEDGLIFYGVARDISDKKQMDVALQRVNEKLETAIAQSITQLNHVHEDLLTEIIERRRVEIALRKSESLYRTLVETIPHGIGEVDATGSITFANSALHRILGYAQGELEGKRIWDLFPEPERFTFPSYLTTLVQEQPLPTPYQVQARTRDGKLLDTQMDWNYKRDEQGRVSGFIAVVTDITDACNELRLRKQTEEMRRALEREQELSALRLRFFSMVSHEFRTPLSTILLTAQVLQCSNREWLPEKQQKNLNRIISAAKEMKQMLDDILTINRAETGRLDFSPTPVELNPFCHQLLEQIQIYASPQHELTFSNQTNIQWALLDEKILDHVLTNLLLNAIKFSPQGGEVQLILTRSKDAISFQICDRGIGIPLSDRPHLFESFHRGENIESIPGSGLGLTVAKKCIELHGGSMTFTSELGVGTTFTVTIPSLKIGNQESRSSGQG